MVADANFRSTSAINVAQTISQSKSQEASQAFKPLARLEKILMTLILGGTVATAISGNPNFTTVPMSALLCWNQINRNRSTQLVQQTDAAVPKITEVDIDVMGKRLDSIELGIAQLKRDMLPRRNLAPIVSKVQQLGTKQFILEKTVVPQMAEFQQNLVELTNCIKALQEDTKGLKPMRQQLSWLEKTLQTQASYLSSKPTPSTQPLQPGQRGRVAIFIDGSNLHYSAQEEGVKIDYAKLLEQLTKGSSELVGVFFYTGVNRHNPNQKRFLTHLRQLGYQIVEKDVVQRASGPKEEGVDVELALNMVDLANCYDTAVLVSGDGDLIGAVDRVKQKGGQVEVVSFRSVTRKTLIEAANQFTDITTLPVYKD